MLKLMKKTVTILLVITLIYANLAGTAFSLISYAINNEESVTNEEAIEEENSFKIEISEFCKNSMNEKETEYHERLNLKLNGEKEFTEIKIQDVETIITDGTIEEEIKQDAEIDKEKDLEEKINIFYKSTKINKEELIKVIGENGNLEIQYIELEPENDETMEQVQSNITEFEEANENPVVIQEENSTVEITDNQENTVVSSDMSEQMEVMQDEEVEEDKTGVINAEEGTVNINAQTEANEEGYITIVYPENSVVSVNINIETAVSEIENLEIENEKIIEKVLNIEKVNLLNTTKQIIVNGEEEILNKQEAVSMPINYTKTVAEIGIDKNQISTSIENKVNFTITMLTNEMKYDLYNNPQFIIELPSEIETINILSTVILNNEYFQIDSVETGTIPNGGKAIGIKLSGEQTEYTKSNEENIQIVIETTMKTNSLIPTLARNINLHYRNENAKTYDGIGVQTAGISTIPVDLVANKEVIVETKATLGEETITSFEEDFATINVAPHTYNMAKINGTVINNIGENIANAKILGMVKNIGPLSGVENVYYTENENATVDVNDVSNGWITEYTQNAKKYLILVENFEQAQTLNFEYNMYMPEIVEEDTNYQLSYEVYDSSNNIIKTSQITIHQEAERFDYYDDELIKANIELESNESLNVGDYLKYKVNVSNITEQDLQNISLNVYIPEILEEMHAKVFINGEYINANIFIENNEMNIIYLNIQKGQTLTIEISGRCVGYINSNETLKVGIDYEQKTAEISTKVKVIRPSDIEASIVSNRENQKLNANEEIQYQIKLENKGESHGKVDIELYQNGTINITNIDVINLVTGERNSIASGSLNGMISNVSINPTETVIINVIGITKELKTDSHVVMYANITGQNINNTTTSKIINDINKKQETIANENENQNENGQEEIVELNNINGTAWLDKNENGKIEQNEVVLKGVQATLIDTQTSKEVEKTITNSEGEYTFENIEKGTYVVVFNYNTTTFQITDYKNEEVENNLDSDVINTTQNNTTVAKTEVIELESGISENVNIGLVLNKEFDMSINKGITKVTVNNEQGTNTYDFANTSMAKVEIDGEYLKGSLILVEYEIAVTNAGEIAGYAKMISDKIPEGMKFNSELNTNWYEDNDGTLYCEALSNKELLPGETAIVKLVLTKEMTEDKVISPVNTVKIEETFNEYLIDDKNNENNSSEATIIISLSTGENGSYIWLILLVIAIISTGILGVIKITNMNHSSITKKERRK